MIRRPDTIDPMMSDQEETGRVNIGQLRSPMAVQHLTSLLVVLTNRGEDSEALERVEQLQEFSSRFFVHPTVLVFARVTAGNAAIQGIVSQVDNDTRDGAVFDMSRADF